ncbi:MAG: c-type cytochrome [Verrucomicrobiales bacterium]|nr:c-type cytochrome [Verrucomicrobiales bacterium]
MQKKSLKVCKFSALWLFVLLVTVGNLTGQEIDPSELPRIPATPPDQVAGTFELRPGIALDLAAHEPLVEDPVSITFDEDGRLFAVEMRGYSERRDDERGQIRLLFDDDDDGYFDRSTIFAKGLKWPTGLVCSRGGIFVVAVPDLIWFKDTDNDGIADEKKVIYTGFGEGAKFLNVQGLPNSLKWGPDNRIWGSSGSVGGKIRRVGDPDAEVVSLSGADFSFCPEKLDLRAENGRAQYGLSFDTYGRRFVSSNSVHIIASMWERDWAEPNPYFALPKAFVSIATDGGAAPVFRISPDEPWRIIRTRWRVAGVVKGVVEGGGRVSGYFTGASGITIYTGDALGPKYVNNAFTGDVGSNLVHRKIISNYEGKVALRADRASDEQNREFIASTDNWFRPTTYCNAPDGCFYISDMYREVIEHPRSLPQGIKKHLDLNSGTDRGRIYRIRPETFTRRKTTKLSSASNDELAALLDHPNGWHRITAQRLLWERDDPAKRYGEGWGSLAESNPVLDTLKLPFQLAGKNEAVKVSGLAGILTSSPDDEWLVAASLHSVTLPKEAELLFKALTKEGLKDQAYLPALAELMGKMNAPPAINTVFSAVVKEPDNPLSASILESLGSGLAYSKNSLSKADQSGSLAPFFARALNTVSDDQTSQTARKTAIRLVTFSPDKSVDSVLESLLRKPGNDPYYSSVIKAMNKRKAPSIAHVLIESWPHFPAPVQSEAVGIFLQQPSHSLVLLSAIEKDRVPKTVLESSQVDLLRKSKSEEVRSRVDQLYPVQKMAPRDEIIASYQEAVNLKGDASKGKEIYQTACASCHKYGGEGHSVGPDLATFKTAGADSIITNLFDPNREVAPQYQVYLFTLKNGEQTMGIIGNETTTEVTVKMAFGIKKKFPRSEVVSMKATGQSLMPVGLESAISKQGLADLLAFILEK